MKLRNIIDKENLEYDRKLIKGCYNCTKEGNCNKCICLTGKYDRPSEWSGK